MNSDKNDPEIVPYNDDTPLDVKAEGAEGKSDDISVKKVYSGPASSKKDGSFLDNASKAAQKMVSNLPDDVFLDSEEREEKFKKAKLLFAEYVWPTLSNHRFLMIVALIMHLVTCERSFVRLSVIPDIVLALCLIFTIFIKPGQGLDFRGTNVIGNINRIRK